MRTIDQFRRKFLAKQPTQIAHTAQFNPEQWYLPVNCIVHFQSNTLADLGIRGNNTLLHNWEENIVVSHVLEGYGTEGSPRRKTITSGVTESYFKNQERVKKTRNLTRALTKPKDLVILDYSLAGHAQIYTQSIREHLYGFQNVLTAVVKNINEVGDGRHHFITINVPDSIPSLEDFNKFDKDPTQAQLEHMLTNSDWWLREVWNLADAVQLEEGQRAGLSKLAGIENFNNVTIILSDHGLFTAVNLGLYVEHASTRASTAQKAFATLLQKIQENRTPVEDESLPEVDEESGLTKEGVSPELIALTEELNRGGALSAKESQRLIKLASGTRKLKSPFDNSKTIQEQSVVTPAMLTIDTDTHNQANTKTASKAQRQSTVKNFRTDYVDKLLATDITNVLTSFEASGVIVTDVKKEEVLDVSNDYVELTVSFVLASGKPGTRKFRYPRIQEDGSFIANGTSYEMDLQKVDGNFND